VDLGQQEYVHLIQPIHVAHASVVDLLTAAGADLNRAYRAFTPLQRAVFEGDDAKARVLAAQGAVKHFYLTGHLYPQLIEPLLELGADVNEMDENGKTALDYALANETKMKDENSAERERFLAIVRLLRTHGGKQGDALPE
jgi:ankyrin repeat protein